MSHGEAITIVSGNWIDFNSVAFLQTKLVRCTPSKLPNCQCSALTFAIPNLSEKLTGLSTHVLVVDAMADLQSMKKTPTIYKEFLTFKMNSYSAPLNGQNGWWIAYGISGISANHWRTKHARKGQHHPQSLRYIQRSSLTSWSLKETFLSQRPGKISLTCRKCFLLEYWNT